MVSLSSRLQRYSQLPYTDPIQRRLAPVFQIFLVGLIAILLLAIMMSLIITGLSVSALMALGPAFIFGCALMGGLYVLRRGHFTVAMGLIILALLINQERSLLVSGFFRNQQALLTSIWPLMLAAFLLNRRWFVLIALGNFLGIAVVALNEQTLLTPEQLATTATPIARLTGFALITVLTCLLLDTLARTFRSELAASIQRERELELEIAARKRAEQALAQQREQYHVTLASIGDGVIATNTAGQVTFLNQVAEELTGWPRQEALDQPLLTIFPIFNEDTLEPVENPLTRVLAEGVVVGLANHTVLATRNGPMRPIADSGAPIRNSDGHIIGAVLVFRDVTEDRQAEIELKASEERFRRMADSAPVLIWISGADKGRTYFNKQWLEFTGRTFEQEMGTGWLDGVHPDDRERCLETYTNAFDQRESFSMEYRLCRKDREYRWVIENGEANYLPDGSFAGYIGSCIDITARKEVEERTRLLQLLTAALSPALTAEAIAQVFIEKGFPLLGVQRGTIALLNEKKTLDIVGQYNMPGSLIDPYVSADDTPLREVIRTQMPLWIDNFDTYQRLFPELAAEGATASEPLSLVYLPMIVHNRTVGAIGLRFRDPHYWHEERRAFLLSLAGQCAQAMDRAQLHRQAQVAAAVEERHRIARDLHDAVTQTLFAATVMSEALPKLWERNAVRGAEQTKQLITLNRAAMSEMRTLLLELRPESLPSTRISTIFQQLTDAAKGRKQIETQLVIEGVEGSLPSDVHVAFYRIAQESINNIIRHSNATEFSVHLQMAAEQARLDIRDNGKGFVPDTIRSDGFGLNNIRERAKGIGAACDIQSQNGSGTHISVIWESTGNTPVSI
jgi:PAS domain S-box-containing protein